MSAVISGLSRVIGSVGIAALLASCGKPTVDVARRDQLLTPCPGFTETGKPPLVHRARCGTLQVPLDPQQPDGEQLGIEVLLLPAVHPLPKPDPLVIIAGGPGQSAIGLAEHIYYHFEEVRKERDLLFIDQRGTGGSAPLACPGVKALGHRGSAEAQQAALLDALRACVEEDGGRMPWFTTHHAVDDLETIRRQLGYGPFNLWGVSYGTRVALAYQQRYPDSVRTSVLDGVAPLALALPWFAEEDALRSLRKLDEACAQDTACARRYGALEHQVDTVVRQLQEQSLNVAIEHPLTRLPYEVELTAALYASALRMALYSRDLARILPLAIHQSAQGDFRLVVSLMALAESRSTFSDISMGMHYTVLCNEDYPQYRDHDPAVSAVFPGMRAVETAADICAFWPVAEVPDSYTQPISSDMPTLMLSGDRDPVTPPRWAESLLPQLTQSLHLVAPGGQHSITFEGCGTQLIARFIQLGQLDGIDDQCIQRIKPLPVYLGVDGEALAALERAEEEAGNE